MNKEQLKASLLQMAIEGKLVPQLDSEKAVEQIGDVPEEVPFEVPEKWKWVKLEEILFFIDYRGKSPKKSSSGIRLITASNIKHGFLDHHRIEYITEDDYKSRQSRGISHNGDILFTTEAPLGHVALADIDIYSAGQRVITLRAKHNDNHSLLMWFLLSPFFQKRLEFVSTGSTAKGVKASVLKKMYIPLPPLEEQKRIVERLEELLPLVEEYGEAQEKLAAMEKALPDQLKASILQEAIQGKLVPQLDTEEPVEQIGDVPEEVPFDVPEKWKWVKLEDTAKYGRGATIAGNEILPTAWVLDLEDIEKDTGRLLTKKRNISSKSNKAVFYNGNVLYSKLRPYLNKVLVADEDGFCTTEIVPIEVYDSLFNQFLRIVLQSPYFLQYANSASYGVKMPRLGTKDAKNALIPLPPLEEQKRIVERVEYLFGQVDALKNAR